MSTAARDCSGSKTVPASGNPSGAGNVILVSFIFALPKDVIPFTPPNGTVITVRQTTLFFRIFQPGNYSCDKILSNPILVLISQPMRGDALNDSLRP